MGSDAILQNEQAFRPVPLKFQDDIVMPADLEEKLNLASGEERLEIMQAVYSHLDAMAEKDRGQVPLRETAGLTRGARIRRGLSWGAFGLVILSSMSIGSVGVYIGSRQMLSAFSFISNPVSTGISVFLVVLEAILFLSFEATFLKELLGANTLDESHAWLKQDEDELKLTKKINAILASLVERSKTLGELAYYNSFFQIASGCNNHVFCLREKYHGEYKEPAPQKIGRTIVTILGAILQVVGGYFTMNSILTGLGAAALIGTPAGWLIAGIGISTFLLMFLSMRGKNMVNLLNPGMKKFNALREKMQSFSGLKRMNVPVFKTGLHKIFDFENCSFDSVMQKEKVQAELVKKKAGNTADAAASHHAANITWHNYKGFSLFKESCMKYACSKKQEEVKSQLSPVVSGNRHLAI